MTHWYAVKFSFSQTLHSFFETRSSLLDGFNLQLFFMFVVVILVTPSYRIYYWTAATSVVRWAVTPLLMLLYMTDTWLLSGLESFLYPNLLLLCTAFVYRVSAMRASGLHALVWISGLLSLF